MEPIVSPVLMAGILIVNLALISYGAGVVIQALKMAITRNVLLFLTLGVIFDITATICMIIGSGKVLTPHGVIGYIALAGMLTETVFSWRNMRMHGMGSPLSRTFIRWSGIAFGYWVIAYITGAVLVMH